MTCQKFEKLLLIVPLQPLQVRQMFQTWGVDIIGPINPATENGNQYILVFIEYFTKWMITIPLPDVNAEVVADMLYQHVYQNFGPPEEILTDNTSNFHG
jgi:hypothetical protein